MAYKRSGNLKQASVEYESALGVRRHLFGEQHPDVAETLFNIAVLFDEAGEKNQALLHYKAALAAFQGAELGYEIAVNQALTRIAELQSAGPS